MSQTEHLHLCIGTRKGSFLCPLASIVSRNDSEEEHIYIFTLEMLLKALGSLLYAVFKIYLSRWVEDMSVLCKF